ncbi:MAG TPA: exodeoxyribonuclease III [Polyangiaceae bacterium]|nr:exodeoxyribonuclease III [Polyangiaceae bacterium]
MRPLRVVSWNVNGIRACEKKGLVRYLDRCRADIVGLQEVRALPAQVPASVRRKRLHQIYAPAERLGYSGVALLSKRPPEQHATALAHRFDVEGRLISARFGKLSVFSAYFPKGSGSLRDNSRIPYKLAFDAALRRALKPRIAAGERILVMGDFNTAFAEIDLARPKQNHENSGFRPEERRALGQWFRAGWVDTFRALQPEGGHYTWWSQRLGLREKNVGWRIDYVLASPAAMPFVRAAFIHKDVLGSDHCPIGVDLNPKILE